MLPAYIQIDILYIYAAWICGAGRGTAGPERDWGVRNTVISAATSSVHSEPVIPMKIYPAVQEKNEDEVIDHGVVSAISEAVSVR